MRFVPDIGYPSTNVNDALWEVICALALPQRSDEPEVCPRQSPRLITFANGMYRGVQGIRRHGSVGGCVILWSILGGCAFRRYKKARGKVLAGRTEGTGNVWSGKIEVAAPAQFRHSKLLD